MDRLSKLSETLNGHPLTTDQRALFERLARACGLKDDDPLWSALIVLGHYERLYEAVPEKILAAANARVKEMRESLDAHLARERTAISADLAEGVEQIVAASLRDKMRIQFTGYLTITVLMVLALSSLCFFGGIWMERTRADADTARLVNWLDTAQGSTAKEFTLGGGAALLQTCRSGGGQFLVNAAGEATCKVRGSLVGKATVARPAVPAS